MELRVESGVDLRFAWEPADVLGAEVQALDATGAVLCEDRLGRDDSIAVPRGAVRLLARDDAGRSAEVPLALIPGVLEQSVTVELQ